MKAYPIIIKITNVSPENGGKIYAINNVIGTANINDKIPPNNASG
jgi:hypothetical protein